MRKTTPDSRRPASRHARLEKMEDRLVMSADPVGAIHLDYLIETELVDHVGQQAMSLAAAHALTGQNNVVNTYGFDGSGQTIAIIDSGVAWNHPALGNGLGPNHKIVGGWDFAENDANPYDDGPMGAHGTHVAGIIGAESGVHSGVATGADIVALRVFDDYGDGYFSWVEQALQWVYNHRNSFANPITTVNLSLGAEWNANTIPNWAMLEDEFALLESAGIFISVAAGNSFTSYNKTGLSYPAVSSHVTPVAAVDANGALASFSQRHERVIAAPGVSITSTVPDYVGNVNGKMDDWDSYSGTSMAAPYVAGASMLLRQAMQFAGQTNITQNDIYNVMYNTADWIYDSITARSYARLNLQAAIDSIMGADDHGTTVATASSLGMLATTKSVSGTLGTLNDVDYFKFTAATSGTVTITGDFTGCQPNWVLHGGGGTIGNGGKSFTFNVQQGQTYAFGLQAPGALGKYSLSIQPSAADFTWTDVGAITQKTLSGLNHAAGDTWYQFTATRAGAMTVEALFAHAAGNVDLRLYDANMNLLATSATLTNNERVDFEALAGQTFFLKASGAHGNLGLRFTNLVQTSGNKVDVLGTSGADNITLRAGATFELDINGVTYTFSNTAGRRFDINAGAGNDRVTVHGSSANETGELRVGELDLYGSGNFNYSAFLRNAEEINVHSGGGLDTINLYDSAGNDYFYGYHTHAIASGQGFQNTVYGFRQVNAFSSGGIDRALLYGTSGVDTLSATVDSSTMFGAGYCHTVHGFRRVYAYGEGGADQATIHGTAGNDTLISTPHENQFSAGRVYFNVAGFAQFQAFGNGGVDEATFHDSAGDDFFSAAQGDAYLRGAGFHNRATNFSVVRAYATQGYDTSQLYDSTAADLLFFTPDSARISSARIDNAVYGFDQVTVFSRRGVDRAVVYGSAGNDIYTGDSTTGQLVGPGYMLMAKNFSRMDVYGEGGYDLSNITGTAGNETYYSYTTYSQFIGAGFFHQVNGFHRTNIYSGGGNDSAFFFDNRRRSDVFYGSAESSRMNGSGYDNTAFGFKTVEVSSGGGGDRVYFQDSKGNDVLTLSAQQAVLESSDYYIIARGFPEVYAHATLGGKNKINNKGADFYFAQFGAW